MPTRRSPRLLLPLLAAMALVPPGCGDPASSTSPEDAATLPPAVAGADLDEKVARKLPGTCKLPAAFYDALSSAQLTPQQLSLPDWGISFMSDPNRFHYTDTMRRQGDLVPDFGCMVAADVEAAVAGTSEENVLRELIAAQGIYGNRAAFERSRFDRAIAVEPSAQPLYEAVKAFYTHPRVEGDPAEALPPWESVASSVATQASRFSPKAQVALAQAIRGLLRAAELRDQAMTASGKMTLPQWAENLAAFVDGRNNLSTFKAAYKTANSMTQAMDFDLLGRAAQLAARSLESLRVALKDEPLTTGAILDLSGPLGHLAISLQMGDDTWSGNDFFLLVDGSGNDTYHDDIAVNLDLYHPIAAVLDLAGDDKYVPSTLFDVLTDGPPPDGGPGTGMASGWYGIAILDDAAGDDQYQVTTYQAYGFYGYGILVDHGGKDLYQGYARSQGAADFGFGLLLDRGRGNDSYETLHNSQGFGGMRGVGWLVDEGGDDRYLAVTQPLKGDPASVPYDQEGSNFSGAQGFGWGLRAWDNAGRQLAYVSGGLGGLFDLSGNDKYECAVMCQGWGYFYGTGMLYDRNGNDSYNTWHKYGMGGGTHQSVGLFLDGDGADIYDYPAGGVPNNGGSEGVGLGYDLGVGFHIDRGAQKDVYTFAKDKMKWGEVLGIARFPGLGVFLNEGGDDEYHVPGQMGAYAFGMVEIPTQDPPVRSGALAKVPSVGMFLDLGGKDTYDAMGTEAKNDAAWTQKAATTNAPMGPFDPTVDFGLGKDGTATWAAWWK